LNDNERTGAYVLAGIVAGGFILGGLGKPGKSKKHDEHDHKDSNDATAKTAEGKTVVHNVVPVAAVPRGDGAKAAEVKPSGSSIQAPAGSKTLAPIMCVPKGTQLSSSSGASTLIASEAASTLARLAQLSTCEVSKALS